MSKILVIAEHLDGKLNSATARAVRHRGRPRTSSGPDQLRRGGQEAARLHARRGGVVVVVLADVLVGQRVRRGLQAPGPEVDGLRVAGHLQVGRGLAAEAVRLARA